MKRWIVGVNGNEEVEVKAHGVVLDDGYLFFFMKDGDRNRNVAIFAAGCWCFYVEEEV